MKIIKLKNKKKKFFIRKKGIKVKAKNIIKYILIFIIIISIFFLIFKILFVYVKKHIIIEVDVSKSFFNGGGPVQLAKALRDVLPYENKKCRFIETKNMTPANGRNKTTNYFYLPYPCISENTYKQWDSINRSKSLLLGPCFVPSNWNFFPNRRYWNERNFREILQTIKGVVVHSKRIREHLSTRSKTTDLLHKFKFLRPCTGIMPKNVKSFANRTNDIIYYEKFPDVNRRKQSGELFNYFKKANLTIQLIVHGYYSRNRLMELANNTKFVIYFSFYDTGAIALKEIQNYGVFCFTHEEDFVINNQTSFLIPELHNEFYMKPAFDKIMNIMQKISNSNPNSQLVAKINQDTNKCQRAFDDLCQGL